MAETIVKVAIPTILGIIMFTMGLGLGLEDFKRVIQRPKAVFIGALSQLVLLPAVGFALAWGMGLEGALAVGLVLVTLSPGGPSSNLMSHLARADTALSVTLTAVSGIVTIVTIPLVLKLALSVFMDANEAPDLPVLRTNLQVLAVVGAPLAAGMWVRVKAPERAASAEDVLKKVCVVLLCILIAGAVAKEASKVADYARQAALPVVALTLITMGGGFALARLARLDRRESVTVTIEVGMQNAAMAITVALSILESSVMSIPGVIYGLWMYLPCMVAVWAGRRWLSAEDAAGAEATA